MDKSGKRGSFRVGENSPFYSLKDGGGGTVMQSASEEYGSFEGGNDTVP